jgi:multiple sugar transport system permease protein
VIVLFFVALAAVAWWTHNSTHDDTTDGRETIVFWGHPSLTDEIYTAIHRFEQRFPKYKVVMSTPAAQDVTGDAQRLLCAISGGVPPDIVYFDRFAIGEWAARNALLDLTPRLEAQKHDDPYRIDLSQYYDWAVKEASYRPPGSNEPFKIYGVPLTVDVRVLWINSNVFRSAGLVDEKGDPRPPKDWDELREYANKLTLYYTPGDKHSGIQRLGFGPNYGNSWLYLYAWQAGGEMMNPDRTKITMTSPPVVRALKFMTDVADDVGGIAQVNAFHDSAQGGILDPFLTGRCAMKVDCDPFIRWIADWKPDMDFMVCGAPLPKDRVAAGEKPIGWSGGFAWTIPVTSRHKEAAFRFIQFMSSWEATELIERGKREQRNAEGRIYAPAGIANRIFYERLVQQYVFDDPRMPATFKRAYATIKELLPNTKIRPVTPVGQLLWAQQRRAMDAANNHVYAAAAKAADRDENEYALAMMQPEVQRQLDELLAPPPPTEVRWGPYLWAYGGIVALSIAMIWLAYHRRRVEYGYRAREVGAALMFASPWMLGFLVLVGGPIVFSIVYSFCAYDVLSPARYVGFQNYKLLLADSDFYASLGRTAFMLLRIPLMMGVSLAIALLLNRAVRALGLYRAAFYLPAIMPLVAASLMWWWLFNPAEGGLNGVLRWIFDTAPAHWMEQLISWVRGSPWRFPMPQWIYDERWSKPSLILMNVWQAGGGMIIWLAGLQSIPPQLYEAANIDGANAWQRFRTITLPMLSPYILFNAIIGLIGTMQIFQEAYIMTQGGPADSTMFYAYYLFRQAFQFFRMGYASALAWILFVVVLALTLLQLWLSKRWVHYEQS